MRQTRGAAIVTFRVTQPETERFGVQSSALNELTLQRAIFTIAFVLPLRDLRLQSAAHCSQGFCIWGRGDVKVRVDRIQTGLSVESDAQSLRSLSLPRRPKGVRLSLI